MKSWCFSNKQMMLLSKPFIYLTRISYENCQCCIAYDLLMLYTWVAILVYTLASMLIAPFLHDL